MQWQRGSSESGTFRGVLRREVVTFSKEAFSGIEASKKNRKRSAVCRAACSRTPWRALRSRDVLQKSSVRVLRSVVTTFSESIFWRMEPNPPTPNQSLQPTHMLVTFRADARPAPSIRVADL